jgi:electron transport complex protein RnfD
MDKKEILNEKINKIHISPAPHLKDKLSLKGMMWWTIIALLLPVLGSIYYFGLKALILVVTCVASAIIFELICRFITGAELSVKDGSAIVTGIILALVIPPSFPLWAAVLGVFFSICIVKFIFGGLGKNIFNPALMGRAFLTAAFPVLITTYALNFRPVPFIKNASEKIGVEAVTTATPLSKIKFEGESYDSSLLLNFFLGEKKGSLGETSGILIIIGLIILLATKVADWRLPLSYFTTIFVFSLLLWLINPVKYLNPFMIMVLGGILLGGTYMVTDPVTTPVAPLGKWVFGIGAGLLTVVIRNWSGYPEGVMFSVLLMNAVTPLINRYTKPRIYGT